MVKFLPGEFEPPEPRSTCSLGGGVQSGSSSSQQSSQGSGQNASLTLPSNLQNPAFVNSAPGTAGNLSNVIQGSDSGISGGFGALSPFSINGAGTASSSNPLVAQVTSPQNTTLGNIGSTLGNLPSQLGSAFSQLSNEMSPSFASSLATSPQTQAAETAAIAPVAQTFASQTVPGLQGSFTQAGQRVGSASGMGSSAFDNAFAAAQGNELATEAATTGAIANNAYQTGLGITANAPAQMGSLSSTELNDLISGLNAQALPQLTQQYGISAGTQLYQSQMATILQALGLQVQGEQPSIGYGSASEGTSTSTSQGTSQGSNFGIGLPNLGSVIPGTP